MAPEVPAFCELLARVHGPCAVRLPGAEEEEAVEVHGGALKEVLALSRFLDWQNEAGRAQAAGMLRECVPPALHQQRSPCAAAETVLASLETPPECVEPAVAALYLALGSVSGADRCARRARPPAAAHGLVPQRDHGADFGSVRPA